MHAIEFNEVTKKYHKDLFVAPVVAVNALSLHVPSQRVVGFVGPNGAGKTTSLKMIAGLLYPTRGTVNVFGKNPSIPSTRNHFSFLTEQPYLYPYLSVYEMMAFIYGLYGYRRSEQKNAIDSALVKVGMDSFADRRIRDLSKGMQQRVNMAGALLGKKELYLFDEPMSGLDPHGRFLFKNIIRQLGREGKTVLFSSHILEDVEMLCDMVIALSDGEGIYVGQIETLLEQSYRGSDIVVETLSEEQRTLLAQQGWNCRRERNKETIFIPPEHDIREVQRFLYEHAVFPESIQRRTDTLETIIAHKTRTHDGER
jgi:ABC-2 type transport system ATP-binding protein